MAAVNPSFVGLDMALALNTAGPGITPATLSVVNARDVKLAMSMGEADVSNRGSVNALSEPTLNKRELSFDMIADETDAVYVAIRTAYLTRAAIELWIANGTLGTAGTVASGGLANVVYSKCVYKVFTFEADQPLENGCDTSIVLKPCKKTQSVAPLDNSLVA